MAYTKHNFTNGQTLKAEHLNKMESAIEANETAINQLFEKVNEKDDEDIATEGYEYTYDGNLDSDGYIWVCAASGAKSFVKVAEIPESDIDLVGAEVSVLVPEWPQNNYTFTITDEMLKKVDGLMQVLYQDANTSDYGAQAMVIVCTKTGEYVIDLNGWVEDLNFVQTGIYLMDSREAWGGKYAASLTHDGASASEENEENPVEYDGNEIQVFSRGLCIGDSITEGVVNYSDGQTTIKKYSYPSVLERITGIEIVNAGVGGLTAKTWYEASNDSDTQYGTWVNGEWVWHVSPETSEGDTVSKSLDYSGFDFSVIHLGINDIYMMGEATIDETISTFESNIYNIINKLKTSNAGIKIFLCTIIPTYAYAGNADYEAMNAKIREIATATDDVFLVDLNLYSKCLAGTPYYNIHLTALGYHKMATEIKSIISFIIGNNLEDFKWIQFTGTDYTE